MGLSYKNIIAEHYQKNWGKDFSVQKWPYSPLSPNSAMDVMVFAPNSKRKMWTYATVGMSSPSDSILMELHIFSNNENSRFVEILGIISHYKEALGLDIWHTINIGEPWIDGSSCTFGLISLPYLDGPLIEDCHIEDTVSKCYWLIPITQEEVAFKKQFGIEALEEKFEAARFNYLDFYRISVI